MIADHQYSDLDWQYLHRGYSCVYLFSLFLFFVYFILCIYIYWYNLANKPLLESWCHCVIFFTSVITCREKQNYVWNPVEPDIAIAKPFLNFKFGFGLSTSNWIVSFLNDRWRPLASGCTPLNLRILLC